jgi:hypothetical protein
MDGSKPEISILADNNKVTREFIEEVKSIDKDIQVSQVNLVGGLAEFVVIVFHWTPIAIHMVMAFLDKEKPQKLQLKSSTFEFTITNEGFSDAVVLQVLKLLCERDDSRTDEKSDG